MDTLQAAILMAASEVFPEKVMKRQEIGNRYNTELSKASGLETPTIAPENTSVYAQYTVLPEHRKQIQQSLREKDIPSVSYYSVPLHLQPVFNNLGHKVVDFPVAEKVANQCLSLPMSPYLWENEQESIIDAFCGR
jgi:UDP-2-acetamido-2-deoxy-ribo-hexuluronate aminotransferase